MFAFWCACLVDRIVDGLEHIGQMSAGHFPIELFGEAFEVDVGGVHGGVEVGPGFGAHVSGSHGDGMNAERSAGFGRVDGIFGEHDRIVIGDAAESMPRSAATCAIFSGLASTPSRSKTAGLAISQFWQNRQPELQPAVPKLSTLEPGWKWLSGFFSTGSTAKPELRP